MTHPGPHRQAKSRSVSGRHQPRSVPRELVELSRELAKVKAQAQALGIFTDDRELLECPNCGLLEDVMADGLLVTYSRRSRSRKDCGLRFSQVDENCFQCPSCGTKVKVVIL